MKGPYTLVHNDRLKQLEERSSALAAAEAAELVLDEILALDGIEAPEPGHENVASVVYNALEHLRSENARLRGELAAHRTGSALEHERFKQAEAEVSRLKEELAEAKSRLETRAHHHKFERKAGRPAPKPPGSDGQCPRCGEAACMCNWELCNVCYLIEADMVHLDERAEIDRLKAEVGRLEGKLAHIESERARRGKKHARRDHALRERTRAAMSEIDRLKAEVGRLGGLIFKMDRESAARISELERERDAAKVQHQAEALQALEKCYMDPNPTAAPDWVNKAKRDRSDLADAMLVIGALGLKNPYRLILREPQAYDPTIIAAFERLGGKGEDRG